MFWVAKLKQDRKSKTIKVHVRGRVQGVNFRYYTMTRAIELGLQGYVKNMTDGSVEAVFSGPEIAVDDMIEWCRQGPSMASVENVIIENCDTRTKFADFSIKYD